MAVSAKYVHTGVTSVVVLVRHGFQPVVVAVGQKVGERSRHRDAHVRTTHVKRDRHCVLREAIGIEDPVAA